VGRAVLLLIVALLGAACTAAPGGAPPTPSAPPSAAPSTIVLPPRPRAVPLDGVDPCSLLTEEQRAELGLDEQVTRSNLSSVLFRGEVPTCTTESHEPGGLLAVGTSTTAGIEIFTAGDLAAVIRPVSAMGFPAVVAAPTRFTDYCSVEVDVAPGQMIDVQFGDDGLEPVIPQPQLCSRAQAIASEVMDTLLQR
jgi:hypothetical protein